MRIVPSIGLSLCLATVAAAQTGTLTGRVMDDRDHPVVGARFELPAANRRGQTDPNGRFHLEHLAPGRYVVRLTAVGFLATSRDVRIGADSTSELVVVLDRAPVTLSEIEVRATERAGSIHPAPDVIGSIVTVGARSEVIELAGASVNLAEKTARQIFGKIPGVFVYDMDGAGNQINIATRGLDPHRSWELNVRQDGVMVNSDIYGYPASHYSLPLEAVERIEFVRGTAALQYGSQFGGLLNYVTRAPDSTRPARVWASTSGGSNGLISTFGSVGGRIGKATYYGYASMRRSEGYRRNANSDYDAEYLAVSVPIGTSLSVRGQFGRSFYRYQIPGPLTDSMFAADPRASTRTRNWFSPEILVPALSAEWRPRAGTKLTAQVSGVFGERSSVQFIGLATTPDLPDVNGDLASRQVDIDRFRSVTGELRLLQDFRLLGTTSTVAAGLAYSDNDLGRRQQGRGTRGDDYDLSLIEGDFGRDVHYRTRNVAVYAENTFRITDRWRIVPGARIEYGDTRMSGRLAYYDPAGVATSVDHHFPLFGVRSEYRFGDELEAYGGISEAYRPMILKDVLPETALERTDPELRDANGWTAELGIRGKLGGRLRFDVGAFALRYDNRFGSVLETIGTTTRLFKTNVGSSLTRGVEISADLQLISQPGLGLNAFTASSFFDAKYRQGTVASGGENRSIVGNRVESVPRWISRSGISVARGPISGSFTVNHVGSTFADALNTTIAPASGAVGLVPGYTLFDLAGAADVSRWLKLRVGVGNLLDVRYFTKRPSFYPGPGIWPSDGRTLQLTAEFGW